MVLKPTIQSLHSPLHKLKISPHPKRMRVDPLGFLLILNQGQSGRNKDFLPFTKIPCAKSTSIERDFANSKVYFTIVIHKIL